MSARSSSSRAGSSKRSPKRSTSSLSAASSRAPIAASLSPRSMRKALKLGQTSKFVEPTEDELSDHRAEKHRLLDVLTQLGPEEILDHILKMLNAADQRSRVVAQRALSDLFPEKYFPVPDVSVAHCARCHHGFDPKYNYFGDCRVAHSDAAGREHTKITKTSSGTKWKLACCEKEVIGSNLSPYYAPSSKDGLCFEGRHTTKQDDIEWYNYVNIFKCNGDGGAPCSRKPAPRCYGDEES